MDNVENVRTELIYNKIIDASDGIYSSDFVKLYFQIQYYFPVIAAVH